MKTNFIALFIFLFCLNHLIAQDCERPSANQNLSTNNIQANLNNSAVLIDQSNNPIGFGNNTFQLNATTLFAHGLWFGALDQQGNLKLSAETYFDDSTTQFIPGPLPGLGNPNPTTCANYDRFFKVTKSQIENHLADFNDNQIINDPIPDIFGWPAIGNPEFENINGFSLPNIITGFAPFHDQNNDGIYNPNDGDFPLPEAVDASNIPDEILWSIFNDALSEQPLEIEIQMTAWAFYCSDKLALSNTIFTSHKIINKSGAALSDMRIGSWTDFDIGCPFDDYIGSIPLLNSFYAYNKDFRDRQSCSPYVSLSREQTMSITFLNQELSSFINFFSLGSPNIPLGMQDPETPQEHYNYLNNSWKDSTPLTFGGDGYNANGGTPTPFAFPSNPNDPNGWSMLSAFLPGADQRGLGVVNIDNFEAGETYVLDIAYSSHHLNSANSFELIDPMITNISELQSIYNNQFQSNCTPLEICEEDCVWPGDANADGIADYKDLIEIGLAFNAQGPSRPGPIGWNPLASDNWSDNFIDGTNYKHADCNGDGVINETDFEEITQFFYNNTHDDYQEINECNEGPQLTIEDLFNGGPLDTVTFGTAVEIRNNYSGMLYGLSFEIEYDTNYIDFIGLFLNATPSPWNDNASIQFTWDTEDDNPLGNSYDYTAVRTDGVNSMLTEGIILFLDIRAKQNLPLWYPPVTQLKFKNVRAVLNDGTPVEFGGTTTDLIFGNLTSIPQVSNDLPITIYPNPVSDKTHVDFNGFSTDLVQLMDTRGSLIKTIPANQLDAIDIDLSDIPNGVYFLKVIGENQFGTFRLIKQ